MARKEKDLGPPRIRSLTKAVFTWFNQVRSEGTPISGPVIQAQAKKLKEDLRVEGSDFGATTGWLKRFSYTKKEARQQSVQRKMTDFFTRP